jgi:hypothetical protein
MEQFGDVVRVLFNTAPHRGDRLGTMVSLAHQRAHAETFGDQACDRAAGAAMSAGSSGDQDRACDVGLINTHDTELSKRIHTHRNTGWLS